MVHTPRLCGERIFVGQSGADDSATEKRKKAINIIDCRPIVKDEVLTLASSQRTPPMVDAAPATEPEVTATAVPVEADHKAAVPEVGKAKTEAPEAQAAVTGINPQDQHYLEEEMDFVLVVDPATGEMKLETSEDGNGILSDIDAGNLDAVELFTSNSLDDLMDKLKNVISTTAQKLNENQQNQGQPADANAGAAQDQQMAALRKQPHKVAGDLPKLTKQQKADQLSRLTRSGAHNHKKIAEAFVNGQAKQAQHHHQQQTAAQQLPQEQRQIGTPQHRNMRRAFETKWDEDEEASKRRQGVGRGEGDL